MGVLHWWRQGLRGGIPGPCSWHRLSTTCILYVTCCACSSSACSRCADCAIAFGYTLRMIRDNAAAREVPRHRRLAREAHRLGAGRTVRGDGRHVMGCLSPALSGIRLLAHLGRGHLHHMLGGVSTSWAHGGTCCCCCSTTPSTRFTEYHASSRPVTVFALGLRKGLLDFVAEWFSHRRDALRALAMLEIATSQILRWRESHQRRHT